MTSEKMAILNMLEQGKITADSAAKLLSALNEDGGGTEAKTRGKDEFSGTIKEAAKDGYGSQTVPGGTGSKSWTDDLGRRFSAAAKDLEPKISKLAGAVAQKSVEFADAAAKAIQTQVTAASEKSASTERKEYTPASSANSESFEVQVLPDRANDIVLRSVSGHISVKGYNGEKASVKISFKARNKGKSIEFLDFGGVYQLNYDMDSFETVNIEAYIPYASFKRLCVETVNGNVDVDNINTSELLINTSKCHVTAKNIKADTMKIDNTDGAVFLSGSGGEKLVIDNANAQIDVANVDYKAIKIETTGESVSFISQGFNLHNKYDWIIRTSNAKIKAILPITSDTAYEMKAYTSLSDVSSGLAGMNYSKNERNNIEGVSSNYNSAAKKVRVEFDTSNAPIYIN